jgi:ABC-type bacteriocin/lantibiotic exporter with double-glycine peptidase domain
MARVIFWHKARKIFQNILITFAFISIIAMFATISTMEMVDAELVDCAFRAVGYIASCVCSIMLYNVIERKERKAMKDVQRRIRRV